MTPYVIRQGDYLAKLAHQFGFDADTVWNDPANADLKELRKTPDILHPGDILQFPESKPAGDNLAGGSGNSYEATIPCVEVILVLTDDEDTLLSNEPCEVEGCGPADGPNPPPQSSDDDGKITLSVPVTQREVTVHLPSKNVTLQVMVGDLDPISETSGAQKRLQNLGFGYWSDEDDPDAALEAAVRLFQAASELPTTGVIDDDTRRAISSKHGI